MRPMMIDAQRRTRRLFTAVTSLYGFTLFTTSGCVMQSTYDAVIEEGRMTRTELARALEEQKVLTRRVSEMELINADVMREAESAVAAVQQSKDAAEQAHEQAEQHIARLQQKVAQASKQHRSLRYELTVAKENTAALQELVDVYQRKVRDGAASLPGTATAEPAVHKPFDPSTIPVPQDLPPVPAVAPPPPEPAPTPMPAPKPSGAKTTQPPADESLFMSVKNWILSLWRSVFS